jgi:hypothetical protein
MPSPPPKLTEDVAATAATTPNDFTEMATEQNCCPETQRLLGGSSLIIAFQQAGTHCLVAHVSTGIFFPMVQAKFRKDIFSFAQYLTPREVGPPSSCVSRYVWHSLARDVVAWAKTCLHYQQSKTHRHIRTWPLHIPIPQRCFPTFILTWWACYNLLIIAITFLPLLTPHPNR